MLQSRDKKAFFYNNLSFFRSNKLDTSNFQISDEKQQQGFFYPNLLNFQKNGVTSRLA